MLPPLNPALRASVLPLRSIAACACILAIMSCTREEGAAVNSDQVAIKALQAEVAYLKDRQQIQDVYLHYMRGFDRRDVDLLRSAFWPDVQINYGKVSSTLEEWTDEHLTGVTGHPKIFNHYGHLLTNLSVDLQGDTAHVESYVTRFSTDREGKGQIVMGRYIDRLDRRSGEWRIAMREFIPTYWGPKTESLMQLYFTKEAWSVVDCALGTWDKRDPSYWRPLTARADESGGPACAE